MCESNRLSKDLKCWTRFRVLYQCYLIVVTSLSFVSNQSGISEEFSPSVTAKCDRGIMYINVVTLQPFNGIVHTRGHRRPPCLTYGSGGFNTTLKVSLLAQENDELYCGVNKYNSDRSVSVAVRPHKSLELSDDKFYLMTCEQLGYKNVRGGTYSVTLKMTDLSGQRVSRTVHGNPYLLRAQLTPFDIITVLRIKNCFSFGADKERVQLLDDFGCPTKAELISQFIYNTSHSAEAIVYEMFKFPESNKLFIQCDAILCRGGCHEPVCDVSQKSRPLAYDGYSLMSASTTVYVFEPSDENLHFAGLTECTEWRFPWLIILCICLAVLLLLMLLLNLFMCSSMSCRCVKTEIVEKESSEMDEYDPYQSSWVIANSRNESRMSLNRPAVVDSSLESTSRSTRSPHPMYYRDFSPRHYSTLYPSHHPSHHSSQHMRPLSRYSTHSTKSQTSQKSRKSSKSSKSQKLPKIIEIDYSHEYKPYTYSLR